MEGNKLMKESLQLQLSEYEMLNSMYPSEKELFLRDPGVVADIQDFLSGNLDCSAVPKLEYVVNLTVQEMKVAINIFLPPTYPDTQPEIQVLCGDLNRSTHENFNSAVQDFLKTLESGTLCIYSIIEWVQENLPLHQKLTACTNSLKETKNQLKLSRMWIHSHHIYSKEKIKNIADWANELMLSGFIMTGKPGLLCVEGFQENCQMWWQRVRSMNWKKIVCKLEEFGDDIDSFRKFCDFEDISAIKDGQQSDMKAFLNYLEQHGSSYVFKDYFGFEGK